MTVDELKTGSKELRSTFMTEVEEAMVVAFRRHTLVPWMTASMPFSSRSRACRARLCIGACSGIADPACLTLREASQNGRRSSATRPMRFDMVCEANGIEHRLTKPNHPWTHGQAERMNRTTKDARVKRFHYDNHDLLRTHLGDLMAACNFGRRLKTLGGLSP